MFVSYEHGVGWWSGQTHSPSEGTGAAVLVELGEALVAYAESGTDGEEEALSRINTLLDTLGSMLA